MMNTTERFRSRWAKLAVVGILAGSLACGLLQEPVPIECSRRESVVGEGYVVAVANQTDTTLSLWIKTDEQTQHFTLEPRESMEFGWLKGFHFGDNTSFSVGGEGYSTQFFTGEDFKAQPTS
jgi:hypothetical protein